MRSSFDRRVLLKRAFLPALCLALAALALLRSGGEFVSQAAGPDALLDTDTPTPTPTPMTTPTPTGWSGTQEPLPTWDPCPAPPTPTATSSLPTATPDPSRPTPTPTMTATQCPTSTPVGGGPPTPTPTLGPCPVEPTATPTPLGDGWPTATPTMTATPGPSPTPIDCIGGPTPSPTPTGTRPVTADPTATTQPTPIATPAPTSTAEVRPDEETSFTHTSGGRAYTVDAPAGAVDQPTTLVLQEAPPPAAPQGFAGVSFRMQAVRDGETLPGLTFAQPLRLTLAYRDSDVAGLDEETLTVFYYHADRGEWRTDGVTVLERRPEQNEIVAEIAHLTHFALVTTVDIEGDLFLPAIQP